MDDNKNMDLWNSVCVTDPYITRQVDQRGGFTAICAQHQRKRATELWGPYGDKWGLKEVTIGYVGDPPEETYIECFFFYPGGQFFISSDLRWRAGGDSRKKIMTDVTTKALSLLGFNSDVFEGRFDDNKYVEKLKKLYDADQKTAEILTSLAKAAGTANWDKFVEAALKRESQVGADNFAKIKEYIESTNKMDATVAE